MAVDASSAHVFISFSSRDQVKAKLICERLEKASFRCWISLRDVEPGSNYQASIVRAIQSAWMMVLIFSDNTNQSQEVHKELSLASAFKISVLPVRITDVMPSGALMYELATRQWIDAHDEWEPAMERLVATARHHRDGAPPPEDGIGMLAPAALFEAAVTRPPEKPAAIAASFSKDQLDTARTALAFYLGPIADVLVRKASAKSTSLADLHDRLAAHIQSADQQTAFRKRIRPNP